MKLELLGSGSLTAPKKVSGGFFFTAGEILGARLADGTLEVRRGVADLPVVATLPLPEGARVALDPRGERVVHVVGSTLTVRTLAGKTVATATVDADVEVGQLEFRKDGGRLWVFGQGDDGFHVYAFDRDLRLDWQDRLALDAEVAPSMELVHPTRDEIVVVTQSVADDPDEATTQRRGLVCEGGALRSTFEDEACEHPCVGFTADGASMVGTDFIGCVLYGWPGYARLRQFEQPDGFEGHLGGIVVGSLLLTDRHDEEKPETTSSLLVLSLPDFAEVAVIPWTKRGPFAKPKDNAALDLSAALGDDSFVELSPGKKALWTARAWRLVP